MNIKKEKPDDGPTYKQRLKLAYDQGKIAKEDYVHGMTGQRPFYFSNDEPRKTKHNPNYNPIANRVRKSK